MAACSSFSSQGCAEKALHGPGSEARKRPAYAQGLQVLRRSQLQLDAALGAGATGDVYQGVYGGQPAAVKVMGQASLWKPAGSYKWEHTVYQQLTDQ